MKKWLLICLMGCSSAWGDAPKVSVDEALASMRVSHEANPQGIPTNYGWWAKPSVEMGTKPHHDYVPKSWAPDNLYQFPGPWEAILPWFLAVNDTSTDAKTVNKSNTGVLVGDINMWFLKRSTLKWVKAEGYDAAPPSWTSVYKPTSVVPAKKATAVPNAEGQLYRVDYDYFTHGGWGRVRIPLSNEEIAAVAVTVRHKLALLNPNGPDDRVSSHIILMAAADYYPHTYTTPEQMGKVPAAGLGRFIRVQNEWRMSTMIVKAEDITDDVIIKKAGTPNW